MKMKPGELLIFETESQGVKVQVVDHLERRELRFGNSIVQSAFSRACPDYLLLAYTRFMTLGMLFHPKAQRLLHIGLGGGCLARFLHHHFPQVQQEIIEPNWGVVQVAYHFFDLPHDPRLSVKIGDGQSVLHRSSQTYDLIFFDAFEAEGTPEHLDKGEFLALLRSRLNPGGWVVGNVWTVYRGVSRQVALWREHFPEVWQAQVKPVGNLILYGGQPAQIPERSQLYTQARRLQKQVPLDFAPMAAQLYPTAE